VLKRPFIILWLLVFSVFKWCLQLADFIQFMLKCTTINIFLTLGLKNNTSQYSRNIAVEMNPATARCRVAACEVLSTAVTGLLHATFWRKCTYRNVSQQITRKLSQISTWFLHKNVFHGVKMPKSVKKVKKRNFCIYRLAAPNGRQINKLEV